jgi:formylglycine-generating enzyme required for sulfatase activity
MKKYSGSRLCAIQIVETLHCNVSTRFVVLYLIQMRTAIERLAQKFNSDWFRKEKQPYRLPSEAEWEYACRAGTTTPFHFGETITSELANYNANYTYGAGVKGIYREQTTPVGSFGVANSFGLYDMHGQVWEWCADHWHDVHG